MIVMTTCAAREDADAMAEMLVNERLAACVSILSGATSWYRWEGNIERAEELVLLIKCPLNKYVKCQERLLELHPYELPEIVAVQAQECLPAYLEWVCESCK
ncbi:MAG: divalent-cation tolerance protein CutA [Gammaproteobacteria bacterium]|nr:MAG: divalent-cation tolerance protein CutA [Gammaproteobacteria bacterium]